MDNPYHCHDGSCACLNIYGLVDVNIELLTKYQMPET